MARKLRVGMTLTFLAAGAAATASLTACPIATAGIFESYMSIDGERRRNEFFSDTTNIVCAVEVRGARTNVTTEMLIRQTQILTLDPPVRATDTNVILAYADFQGAGKQVLELKPADPKDAGEAHPREAVPGRSLPAARSTSKASSKRPYRSTWTSPPARPSASSQARVCGGFYEEERLVPTWRSGHPQRRSSRDQHRTMHVQR